ncbi:MAG: SURF1 family protein [Natronospirillum sp.]
MSLFVAFFLPVTLALGSWQLNRAAEKNQVLTTIALSSQQTTLWTETPTPVIGSRVEVCVEFTGDQWFLDNRTLDGQVGYDVFLPAFRCTVDAPVLVRLGWIEQATTRSVLPNIDLELPTEDGQVTVHGQIRPTAPPPWLTSGPEQISEHRWRFQSMDELPDPSFVEAAPILQLEEPKRWVLADAWNPVNVPPERHIGYAIQWFGLAAVLVIGFIIWGIRRSRELEQSEHHDDT